jgi:hypothetical protein
LPEKTRTGKKSTREVIVDDVSEAQWDGLLATACTSGKSISSPDPRLFGFPEGSQVKAKWRGQVWVPQGAPNPMDVMISVKYERITLRFKATSPGHGQIKMKLSVSRMPH